MTYSDGTRLERVGQFFARNDNKHELKLAPGPFKEQADELSATLKEHSDLLNDELILGGIHPSTPMVRFTYSLGRASSGSRAAEVRKVGQAAAYTDQVEGPFGLEDRLFVAIDSDTSNPDMHRVIVDSDGNVLDRDNPDMDLANDNEFKNAFPAAIRAIDQSLREVRAEKIYKRKQMGKAATKVIAVIAGVASISGAGYYGYNKWIIEPAEADRVARAAYDSEEHMLPGEPLELKMIDAAVLPTSQFDEIPEMKDGDDLASPRTIDIEPNTCKAIDLNPKPNQELVVAIPEDSILSNSGVTAYLNPDGKIELCVTDTTIDSLDYDDAPIAIQLR